MVDVDLLVAQADRAIASSRRSGIFLNFSILFTKVFPEVLYLTGQVVEFADHFPLILFELGVLASQILVFRRKQVQFVKHLLLISLLLGILASQMDILAEDLLVLG